MQTQVVTINTDLIRLDSLLKFAAVAASGGEAKILILQGLVSLNGDICTQRTKKVYPGDIVEFDGLKIEVVREG